MKNKILIFSDLDNTIWYSKRHLNNYNEGTLTIGTYDKKGYPHGFITEKEKKFLNLINTKDTIFIPVTARNHEQYQRTILYKEKLPYSFLNLSSTLLLNNMIDHDWYHYIENLKKDYFFNDVETTLKTMNITFQKQDNNYFYFSTKNLSNIDETIINLKNNIVDTWDIIKSTDTVFIKPDFIDKKLGVQYLIDKLNPELTIGIGDSIMDKNFLDIVDFSVLPQKSELKELIK